MRDARKALRKKEELKLLKRQQRLESPPDGSIITSCCAGIEETKFDSGYSYKFKCVFATPVT